MGVSSAAKGALVLVGYNTLALADNTDDIVGLVHCLEDVRRLDKLILRDDDHKTDAHVEHTVHLIAIHLALTLDELENRRHFPRRTVDFRIAHLRQNARNVVRESAAGDVRHTINLDLALQQLGNRLEEALVDGQ